MSLENKLITTDVVEIQEFPNLARHYNVSGVPKTVINDVIQFTGSIPEAEFLEKVMQVGYRDPQTSDDEA
jgi:protein-disulfide isomerase